MSRRRSRLAALARHRRRRNRKNPAGQAAKVFKGLGQGMLNNKQRLALAIRAMQEQAYEQPELPQRPKLKRTLAVAPKRVKV